MEILDVEDLILMIRKNLAARKRDLKKEYKILLDIFDEYPCGVNLATYISPRISQQQDKVNKVYDECMRLEKILGNPFPEGTKEVSSNETRVQI